LGLIDARLGESSAEECCYAVTHVTDLRGDRGDPSAERLLDRLKGMMATMSGCSGFDFEHHQAGDDPRTTLQPIKPALGVQRYAIGYPVRNEPVAIVDFVDPPPPQREV
jgi:hypothetical protein